jgi:hypothetical protein
MQLAALLQAASTGHKSFDELAPGIAPMNLRIGYQIRSTKLLAALLAGSVAFAAGCAQLPNTDAGKNGSPVAAVTSKGAAAPTAASASASARSRAAGNSLYFKRNWGIEIVNVKPVTSGYMLAFRYRITDPDKARQLNDRKSKAYIIDEASGIRLAVPAMEKVGELRSGSAPEADRIYFMVFGNPGKLVKPGSRISVVVGNFRADGIIVS